ncbi:hypothetical protein HOE37_00410 [Candidatus Woesearchaeota archaeon]|jgi:hypothetical protein|nr:hypothetical protein [Candidatus Woesearchaeota archaeon]MBT4110298.1 hypothetical protein [Candidatus Woesearchaeota archaeon]MBT4336178.1 hypothetical protein [Candidatus Woesearchaeota archaeon]MBT4468843.1 hypothetical protein [Candidatus Woesearchaeota archaeon]MBT6744838.1 hypothetical protein [Candidatus Woesearchaeota archaeon]
MKKSVSLTLCSVLVILALFLSSCGGAIPAGEKPQDTAAALTAVQTGTQGVEIQIIQNQPPALIYDDNELIAMVEVHNKGNDDIEIPDCYIQVTGFDKSIISGSFTNSIPCAANMGVLEGKNVYNTLGATNVIQFTSPNVNLPTDVFEYNPVLNFLTCYRYTTTANPQVCIDPLFYQITSEQKACIPHDVGMGGGQGAPVGVSYVGVDMIGDKAIFEINVVNNGGGRVLDYGANIQNCGGASLEYKDLDVVEFEVSLNDGSPLNCKPLNHKVRLTNNQGKIVCTSNNIGNSNAYETILQVKFDYSYIDSYTQPLKIVASPLGQ